MASPPKKNISNLISRFESGAAFEEPPSEENSEESPPREIGDSPIQTEESPIKLGESPPKARESPESGGSHMSSSPEDTQWAFNPNMSFTGRINDDIEIFDENDFMVEEEEEFVDDGSPRAAMKRQLQVICKYKTIICLFRV